MEISAACCVLVWGVRASCGGKDVSSESSPVIVVWHLSTEEEEPSTRGNVIM